MARVSRDGFRTTRGLRHGRRLLAGAAVALIFCQTPLFAQENKILVPDSTTDTIVPRLSDVLRGEGVPAALDRLKVGPRRRVAAGDSVAQRSSSSPRGGWVARHPVLLGTLIGAGVGSVWQAGTCRGSSCNVGIAGLVGAGSGAYAGLIVSATQKARRQQPVDRRTKIGIAAGAVGAAAGAFLACYGAGGCGGVS
jgi:hypothetical protein